jgi:transposase
MPKHVKARAAQDEQEERMVRKLARFNAEGIAGLGMRPGSGRKARLREQERSRILALVK